MNGKAVPSSAVMWMIAISALLLLVAPGCRYGAAEGVGAGIVDPRDGQAYPVIRVGSQTWLGRDLSFDADGSHCYGNARDCPPRGRLYPWEVAMRACAPGWRLPSEDDWQALERHLGIGEPELGAEGFRGTDQGARLGPRGATGFEAPIDGYRRPDGSYARRGERSAYWAATLVDDEVAWHRDLRSDDERVYRSAVPKGYALSVRCVLDE